MNDNTLVHYGILGMKWGVRRTEAQLARARGEIKSAKPSSKNNVKKSSKKSSKADDGDEKKPTETQKPKKKISEMSDDELRKEINRLSLVKQYKDLMASTAPKETPKNSKAKQLVEEMLTNSAKNIGTQAITYVMGKAANKVLSGIFDDAHPINEKKGQKDK